MNINLIFSKKDLTWGIQMWDGTAAAASTVIVPCTAENISEIRFVYNTNVIRDNDICIVEEVTTLKNVS